MKDKRNLTDLIKKLGTIEFVKDHFIDLQGNIRELTVTLSQVGSKGHSSTDGSSVYGKIVPPTESDMLLVPDPETVSIIPWQKDTARVICDVYYPPEREDMEPKRFEGCSRGILEGIVTKMETLLRDRVERDYPGKKIEKFHAHFAPEVEFILLPADYDEEKLPFDKNMRNDNYFVPPAKAVDAALKEMTASLSMLQMRKEKFHTEVARYQCEIGIGHGNVVSMADAVMTVRYLIKAIAENHDLKASFIPKFNMHVNGSGMHVHQNLAVTLGKEEQNLFLDMDRPDGLSSIARSYIEGLLVFAPEITALTNSFPISYKRLVPGCEAPTYIAWDWKNRTALIRLAAQMTRKIRAEYRAADPLCNPYLAFSAMLAAGLEGIEQGFELRPNDTRNLYHENRGVTELPGDYLTALENMNGSAMLRKWLGDYIIDQIYKLGTGFWKKCPRSTRIGKKVTRYDMRLFF